MIRLQAPTPIPEKLKKDCITSFRSILQRQDLGFWQLPKRNHLSPAINEATKRMHANGNKLLLFGIGGSSLGPQFLCDLYSHNPGQIGICDNVDPVFLDRVWQSPDQWKTGSIVIISKSGNTIETLATLQRFHEFVHHRVPDWHQRALVVTEPKANPLSDWAKSKNVPVLEFPVDVGGRFSVLSPVGMLFACFLGQSLEEFSSGAAWALEQEDLITDLMGQTLLSFERGEWITLFWNYCSLFRYFGPWLVQLWSESLGKKLDLEGKPAPRASTPMAAIGATDQHSMLQQVMEGYKDKLVVMQTVNSLSQLGSLGDDVQIPSLRFLKGQSLGKLLCAEARSTADALRSQGVHVLELQIEDLSPRSMGALLMMWELVVAGLGSSLGIDAFNQPGVELGKRLALKILQH